MALLSVMSAALVAGMLAPLARAGCSSGVWADDYSPERCRIADGAAVVSCNGKRGPLCGMRMSSHKKVGFGVHSMTIKAAPGAGVATTFYLSTNGGLYDKMKRNPWVELDWEILGLQAGPRTRIWTNLFTGIAQEHNQMITVPFDVSAAYHTYTFRISESSIVWEVDGAAYRSIDIRPYPDVVGAARDNRFQLFASVWGRSSHEPGEGIPAFRNALGLLDYNRNPFPLYAGIRRPDGRRLEVEMLPGDADNRTLVVQEQMEGIWI